MNWYHDAKLINPNFPKAVMYRDIKRKRMNDIEMSLNLSHFSVRRWSTGNSEQRNTSLTIPERMNRLNIRLSSGNFFKNEENSHRNVQNDSQRTNRVIDSKLAKGRPDSYNISG